MATYEIAKLEWKRSLDYESRVQYTTSTIFGEMRVYRLSEDEDSIGGNLGIRWEYSFEEYRDEGFGYVATYLAGKEAAEAFYLDRLLPALIKVMP